MDDLRKEPEIEPRTEAGEHTMGESAKNPFVPAKGWVWVVWERFDRYSGAALMSARNADVLAKSLIIDTATRSITTYAYDPTKMNNVGPQIDRLNYTAIKEARLALKRTKHA